MIIMVMTSILANHIEILFLIELIVPELKIRISSTNFNNRKATVTYLRQPKNQIVSIQ